MHALYFTFSRAIIMAFVALIFGIQLCSAENQPKKYYSTMNGKTTLSIYSNGKAYLWLPKFPFHMMSTAAAGKDFHSLEFNWFQLKRQRIGDPNLLFLIPKGFDPQKAKEIYLNPRTRDWALEQLVLYRFKGFDPRIWTEMDLGFTLMQK